MRKSEETTKKILDTVVELLKTQDTITIKDICEKAYINIAAVNYHFGDKDTLIVMAVQKIIAELKTQITALAAQEFESTESALSAFVELIYNFAAEYSGAVRYMINSGSQSQGNKILQQLFADESFTKFILEKMQTLSNTADQTELMSKYLMMLSAFIFPMVCQYALAPTDSYSLLRDDFKQAYIKQILKILTV